MAILVFNNVIAKAESKLVNCTEIEEKEKLHDCIKHNQDVLARERGYITGVVTDETGKPLENVSVSASYMGDSTDINGRYKVPYQPPGVSELVAQRRDLIEFKTHVKIIAGKSTHLDFSMKRQEKACCRLKGTWQTTLLYKSKKVQGTISFNNNAPDPNRRTVKDDPTIDEFGIYDIDLQSLLGDRYYETGSTTIFDGNKDTLLIEANGYVHTINHVHIILIPGMSHGGLSLDGKIVNNTINGTWYKREYGTSIGGEFVMKKITEPIPFPLQ